jgi:hypothetical protein
MVDRLVQMGWLRRQRQIGDRRHVVVALTELGLTCLHDSMHLSERPLKREMGRFFAPSATRFTQVDCVVGRAVVAWWDLARFFHDCAFDLYGGIALAPA